MKEKEVRLKMIVKKGDKWKKKPERVTTRPELPAMKQGEKVMARFLPLQVYKVMLSVGRKSRRQGIPNFAVRSLL